MCLGSRSRSGNKSRSFGDLGGWRPGQKRRATGRAGGWEAEQPSGEATAVAVVRILFFMLRDIRIGFDSACHFGTCQFHVFLYIRNCLRRRLPSRQFAGICSWLHLTLFEIFTLRSVTSKLQMMHLCQKDEFSSLSLSLFSVFLKFTLKNHMAKQRDTHW